ncbi:flagellar M-ring protein [Candidatus Photodesmus blepharus]|uniref:Flagellar M-ring protein n=1 Tax=Candidatus Photodesmus blepharonis TaxID=1179155 RepID=A0A084CP03_9GAMM|nr:flagellar basal-body MS-ring/collar protein FliF [Candidatus Photodesmus blepharus]KEY91532.1 flagellar M-ring protein [Candidatus Photodesmus blepharus]
MADANQTTDLTLADSSDNHAMVSSSNPSVEKQNSGLNRKNFAKFNLTIGNLDLLRQIVSILSISICVALIIMLFFWAKESEMRPLGTYETNELIPILDYLDQRKANYKLEGNTLSVPVNKYSSLKLDLARAGLNQETQAGDEILLKDMGFGVSQRLESERLKLSRERQLSKAIEEMQQVRKARVLLALPKQSVFVRHHQEASASVFLTLRTGSLLKQEEIYSVIDMVSSAVPGMKPSRITVTDQHGRLLNSGSQDSASSARSKEHELERKQEQTLREKIDSVLIPILGFGNYTAQVDIELDFSTIEQTRKHFDPKSPSTRSEHTLEDYNNGNIIGGIPGALSNQPPADASIPEDIAKMKSDSIADKASTRKESTRNFELDTTVSHERRQTGTISRQTISVAVKNRASINPDSGQTNYTPLSNSELDSIRQLLIGAVGFNEMRGDLLNVLSMQFAVPEVESTIDTPIWEHPNFNNWMRWITSALIIIVIVVVLLQPAMKKLLNPTTNEEQLHKPDNLSISDDSKANFIDDNIENNELLEFTSNIDLPNLHKDEDILKAVRSLVANEPELAAQVVKNWMK